MTAAIGVAGGVEDDVRGAARRPWRAGVVCVTVALVLLGWSASCAWAGFGVVPGSFTAVALNKDGSVDHLAGSHPYEYDVAFSIDNRESARPPHEPEPEGNVSFVEVHLPPGLVGNPDAVPRCPRQDFEGEISECPGDTQIGEVTPVIQGIPEAVSPLFNLVPPKGVPASFGFSVISLNVFEEASVLTGDGYGVSEGAGVPITRAISVSETVWGVPTEESHNAERSCVIKTVNVHGCSSEAVPQPLITLPGSCTGPLVSTLRVVSSEGEEAEAESEQPGLTNCEKLSFTPSLSVRPEQQGAESPSGLTTELKIPIPQPESVDGYAEADLKEAVVTLPLGVTVSPSAAADGLAACPLRGSEGIELKSSEPAKCPQASKLGTVEVHTPLLEEPLKGSIFLAQQGDLAGFGENPFGSLLAIYVVAEGDGVVAKIPGKIELDGATGQLTARFGGVKDVVTGEEYLPQLPYDKLTMSFFGGPQAALITPSECGTYTTTSRLVAWNSTPGHPVVAEPSSSFTIDQGCAHAFSPSFTAGTTNPQAAEHSTFTTAFARNDGEQRFKGLEETLPPGLLASVAGVSLCGNAEAEAGACPEASRIGTVTVHAGPGSDPLAVQGAIYLTTAYGDGSFGEVVEVPAIAGPFNLDEGGTKPIVVRGSIAIDPETAQASVQSDPFPQLIGSTGVPTDVREVDVTLNHEFALNPTNCSELHVTAVLSSTAGTAVERSSPFHAANCAALPFKPSFKVSTQARTSKANGASLTVKVGERPGEEANIQKVDLQIPKILPARLTTLQKACAEKQFDTNPAGCPAGSVIATATAHTPILQAPLTGPGYLVSHGNAAFPDVEFVLQADERGGHVEIVLDGKTDIKKGITYSKFETVPDAPVSSFETVLPEGPHSVLTAEQPGQTNLCQPTKTVSKRVTVHIRGHTRHETRTQQVAEPLTIPTKITGQNGAVIQQNTTITVTGCPKKIHTTKKHRHPAETRGKQGGR
jgi:hypothetical protein